MNVAAEDGHQHPLWDLSLAGVVHCSWVDGVANWRGNVLLQAAVGALCPVVVLQDAFEARSKTRNATLQAASGNGTTAAAKDLQSAVSLPLPVCCAQWRQVPEATCSTGLCSLRSSCAGQGFCGVCGACSGRSACG